MDGKCTQIKANGHAVSFMIIDERLIMIDSRNNLEVEFGPVQFQRLRDFLKQD